MHSRFFSIIFLLAACICLTCCKHEPDLDKYRGGLHLILNAESKGDPAMDSANIAQITEAVGRRLDNLKLKERIIRTRGNTEVVIQLPPCENPDIAVHMISMPAVLEFKLVDEDSSLEDALKGNAPPGREILYQVENKTGAEKKTPLLLEKNAVLTGLNLNDARAERDETFDELYIEISFDPEGTRLLEQVTGENIGRKLAIVLDGVILSAPVIREKISGGKARISGRFTEQEAKFTADALKAGAYPVRVQLVEYKTIDENNWLGNAPSEK